VGEVPDALEREPGWSTARARARGYVVEPPLRAHLLADLRRRPRGVTSLHDARRAGSPRRHTLHGRRPRRPWPVEPLLVDLVRRHGLLLAAGEHARLRMACRPAGPGGADRRPMLALLAATAYLEIGERETPNGSSRRRDAGPPSPPRAGRAAPVADPAAASR
jgi:hypothetical protein